MLKDIAGTLNLAGADLSGKIFDDMVDWIVARGEKDLRWQAQQLEWLSRETPGQSLAEIRNAVANAPDPAMRKLLEAKRITDILGDPNLSEAERAVALVQGLEAEIKRSGPEGHEYSGRRPGVRDVTRPSARRRSYTEWDRPRRGDAGLDRRRERKRRF